MQKTSKQEWMKTWEIDLAHYREEISSVPEDELAQVKGLRNKVDAAFEATGVCICGGILDKDKVLFCPACKSTNLSYQMDYIT